MKTTRALLPAALAIAWAFSTPATAEVVTVRLTATVNAVQEQGGGLGGAVQVGDTITGTYTYDLTTPDSEPDPSTGVYRHNVAPYGMTLKVNELTFQTNYDEVDFRIRTKDGEDWEADAYWVRSLVNLTNLAGADGVVIVWLLSDSSGSALSSTALPATPPNLANWDENYLIIEGNFGNIQATVTEAVLSVPTVRAVTTRLTATVTSISDPRGGALGGAVHVGDTITGTYTYDLNAPDTHPDLSLGVYRHHSAPFGMNLKVNGITFRTDPDAVDFGITVANDRSGQDAYTLWSRPNLTDLAGAEIISLAWYLYDSSATALSSIALPFSPPNLTDWDTNFLWIEGSYSGEYFWIAATVTKVFQSFQLKLERSADLVTWENLSITPEMLEGGNIQVPVDRKRQEEHI
jgi:hypothetical protein